LPRTCFRVSALSLAAAILLTLSVSLPTNVRAQAEDAEAFYLSEVESIVQARCIVCHVEDGVAEVGQADILFTGSALDNHQVFIDYVNTPRLGSRANRVLSKIRGASNHGGGTVIAEDTSDYQTFSEYMTLLSTEPAPPAVFRASLEEPLNGEVHTGVGNLRGWAVASDGIFKIEVLIDGAYVFDAPYGGLRSDVGGAFPDVDDADRSGFSLAYNYSDLPAGEHTVTIVAQTEMGETLEQSSTFNVVRFERSFIAAADAVDLSDASCAMSGDEISIIDGVVDGNLVDLILKWRTAEQGFEIVEVR
jgi:hypothetical protein